jgi:CheY-like chemotaxis protein/HPt (histidine-containing phosphotransfer) domain-containing protein
MSIRILHVDDDPHIRHIVELSLSLDPTFIVTSCASGDDALAVAADRAPDLILCDVMMPGMDGPTVLARLQESASTAKTPLVFMTARAQPGEIEQLTSLGATAVITKPFDPMTLADTVRGHLRSLKFAAAGYGFAERLHDDAAVLAIFRTKLESDSDSSVALDGLHSCVHKLAGAAGVFDFQAVSCMASTLEESIIERREGRGIPGGVEANLDALLECIERG